MSLIRQLPRLTSTRVSTRAISTTVARMADGDAGSPRSGGTASGDAFTRREQASEDFYVKQQEKDKLSKLKQKIADQEAQLAKDRDEVEALQTPGKK